jgi:hypothetical protein
VEIDIAPFEATDRCFELGRAGDLLVIQVDEADPMLGRLMDHLERRVADA